MALADAEEIFAYWEEHPPAYQAISLIAQMLGWKPRRKAAASADDWAALAGIGFGETRDVHEGLGAVVLDFETLKRQHARKAG